MAAKKRDDEEREPEVRNGADDREPPVVRDKRRIDPETGEPRAAEADAVADDETPLADDGAPTDAEEADELIAAEDADVEVSESGNSLDADIDHILSEAGQREIEEYRDRAARAEAELANFRTRVERDRQANREAVVADVIRSLLPAIDDLDRAAAHGDLEGSPLELVAQKMRAGFERFGVRRVGEVGEVFDPGIHEAIAQLPSAEATEQTVADVIEVGYALGERLVRPAKVAVRVPQE